MFTTVVNVKVAHLRPKYKDLADWMSHPEHVYVGRRGVLIINGSRYPPVQSIWANPYKIKTHGTREEVLANYRSYIMQQCQNETIKAQLLALKGKVLGCWCKPEPCHGDILVELIDQLSSSDSDPKSE